MTIHLSKDLEKFVQDAVRDGLYAREHDVIRDALLRLKQTMPGQKTKHAKPAQQKKKPLTRAEFDQKLLELGLMSQLPDSDALPSLRRRCWQPAGIGSGLTMPYNWLSSSTSSRRAPAKPLAAMVTKAAEIMAATPGR
jgi:Arc/MetJ-type ribon-helix-helix transcriptional regulator